MLASASSAAPVLVPCKTKSPQGNQILMKKDKKEKKKRKEKEKKEERRAFDREKDLLVNRFDDAQKQAIIKRSQMLNSRFTHSGTTSHFL
nr:KAGPALPP motifs-containing protein 1 [Biomphalaria glabrata]